MCPVLVPSFIGVLEGQLDEHIEPDNYYMYLGWTNYTLPKDSALFVWPPPTAATDIGDRILPETTTSGAMLNGLVFCGTDKRMNCPTEFWKEGAKGAMVSFWQAVYSGFAKKAGGLVKMVILEENVPSMPSLWNASVLPNLSGDTVTSVDIMASNCDAPGVSVLIEAIQSNNIMSSCTKIEPTGSAKGTCEIADLLQDDAPAKDDSSTTTDQEQDHGALEPSQPLPPAPPSVDCDCPVSVYAYLFWAIIVVMTGGAFSMWSVRHYLPQYQSIPDAEIENGGGHVAFPKQ